jgi:hypothetical protein
MLQISQYLLFMYILLILLLNCLRKSLCWVKTWPIEWQKRNFPSGEVCDTTWFELINEYNHEYNSSNDWLTLMVNTASKKFSSQCCIWLLHHILWSTGSQKGGLSTYQCSENWNFIKASLLSSCVLEIFRDGFWKCILIPSQRSSLADMHIQWTHDFKKFLKDYNGNSGQMEWLLMKSAARNGNCQIFPSNFQQTFQ